MSPEYKTLIEHSPRARLLEKRSALLSSFLAEHGLGEPKNIEFAPLSHCHRLVCFPNVEAQVRAAGGQLEAGWVFWEYEDICVHTEAHAIWITPQGRRRDITPRELPPAGRILFLPDRRVAQKRGFTAGYRTILSTDPHLRALESYASELEVIFDEFYPGIGQEFIIPTERFKAAADRVGLPYDAAKRMIDLKKAHFTTPL